MTYQAKQYAHALFGLLKSKEEFEQAITLLKSCKHAYEKNSQIRHFFDNPNLKFPQKKEIILKSFEAEEFSAPEPVKNLALLMTENLDLYKLSKTIYMLKKIGDKQFDILEIRVTAPTSLSPELTGLLEEKFQEHEGQTVIVREKIDEHMIAGLTIKIHDRLFDASITNTLEHLLTHGA